MTHSNSDEEYNVVFMGNFGYPEGMAGTKRIQHAADLLQNDQHTTSVLQLHQPDTSRNPSSGVFRNSPFVNLDITFKNVSQVNLTISNRIHALHYLKKWYRPDRKNIIYHYKRPVSGCILKFLYARLNGYRIVLDITEDVRHAKRYQGSVLNTIKHTYHTFLQERTADLADGVFTVSRTLLSRYRQICHNRIPVVHRTISVDANQFQRSGSSSFHQPVRLLYSGSFAPKDGVENLIRAFDTVSKQYSVELTLTGTGKESRMKNIRTLIADCAHSERIKLTGYLPKDDYYHLIESSDIACVPRIDSPYARAGFPFKLGEYLATGKPVVASRVSDVEQYLDHGVSAILIEPGSVASLESGLSQLLDDPDRAREIGARGRRVAEEQFGPEAQRCQIYEMFRAIN
jgi:glycosyltransferase involved in cell wall biosynthesis